MSEQIETELTQLVGYYQKTSNDRAEACKLLDIQIENLREARDAIACPYNARLSELETMIRLPMRTRAKTFICDFGKVLFKKGAVRRSWNLDALDQVCIAKPEIKDAIWAFREEKAGEPSITVKVEEVPTPKDPYIQRIKELIPMGQA